MLLFLGFYHSGYIYGFIKKGVREEKNYKPNGIDCKNQNIKTQNNFHLQTQTVQFTKSVDLGSGLSIKYILKNKGVVNPGDRMV